MTHRNASKETVEKARKKINPPMTPERLEELCEKLDRYIEETDIPILAEFAYKNNIDKRIFWEHIEFEPLVQKALAKKESNLERALYSGEINAPGAIFALKQLGWKDRHDVGIGNMDGKPLRVHKADLDKLTTEELERLEALLEKAQNHEAGGPSNA